jgi:hypothetical protein
VLLLCCCCAAALLSALLQAHVANSQSGPRFAKPPSARTKDAKRKRKARSCGAHGRSPQRNLRPQGSAPRPAACRIAPLPPCPPLRGEYLLRDRLRVGCVVDALSQHARGGGLLAHSHHHSRPPRAAKRCERLQDDGAWRGSGPCQMPCPSPLIGVQRKRRRGEGPGGRRGC